MPIWITPFSLEELNARGAGTLSESLSILFVDKQDDSLTASMPVVPRVCQPRGVLHGGALCALAETVGSAAGNYCIDQKRQFCVGLEINANHLKAVRSGTVYATATPFHLGSSTQVWEIKIRRESEPALISVARLTTAIRDLRCENPGLKAWDCVGLGGASNPSQPVFEKPRLLRRGFPPRDQ